MLRTSTGLLLVLIAVCGSRAQEPVEDVTTADHAMDGRPATGNTADARPDAPKSKIEPEPPTPCPAGTGKPCAFLGGRAYFPDQWKMTQHDRTWADAMKHPAILSASALLVGTSILDIEGTDHCLQILQCKEINPLMPKKVDRPRQYATVLGLDMASIYWLGRAKQRGKGNREFAIVYAQSIIHLVFGLEALRLFAPSATLTSATNPHPKVR
jgi:hypothetical protein